MTDEEVFAVYKQVYDMTSSVTVTPFDCGTLCDKRCCRTFACTGATGNDQDYGMELYPGEELFLADELKQKNWLNWRFLRSGEYHLPANWEPDAGVYFVGCVRPCPRERRPLQCRLFPYKPVLKANGRVRLVLDKGPGNYCPLTEEQLDEQAREQLEKAIELLGTIPKVRELLWWDAQPKYEE